MESMNGSLREIVIVLLAFWFKSLNLDGIFAIFFVFFF